MRTTVLASREEGSGNTISEDRSGLPASSGDRPDGDRHEHAYRVTAQPLTNLDLRPERAGRHLAWPIFPVLVAIGATGA